MQMTAGSNRLLNSFLLLNALSSEYTGWIMYLIGVNANPESRELQNKQQYIL